MTLKINPTKIAIGIASGKENKCAHVPSYINAG